MGLIPAATTRVKRFKVKFKDFKGIVCFLFKWGCIRYSSIVSILHSVERCGEADRSTDRKQSYVMLWMGAKEQNVF